MIRTVYVEKRAPHDLEARALLAELKENLGLTGLEGLRVINRYYVSGLSQAAFDAAIPTVFSEPPLDHASLDLRVDGHEQAFAVAFLPGQFDQRADSAAQCIQMQTAGERPLVRSAKVYALSGSLSAQELASIKRWLINPVECRETGFEKPQSLEIHAPQPPLPPVLAGFRDMDDKAMAALQQAQELAMGLDDLQVCMDYFKAEGRDPSLTELKVLDTYWSDHCRHTTFLTRITDVDCPDPHIAKTLREFIELKKSAGDEKPLTLMNLATLAAKAMSQQGLLPEYEQTEEVNACTIRVKADTSQGPEDWLLFFKNETHNHPTEIEPFGGAATCIGGAIRDPLSARAYVYAGMRVTGAADPTQPISQTMKGKLPQRQIVTGAAAGFSSYGNQIGVATGYVKEYFHPGFAAKRMECGAVLGAAKASHVRRERPEPGDVIILLGGRTGRDGIGGATGSSMAHSEQSVDVCAAQVQKGNAPEERKLQRLFLNPGVTQLIKRCNDFGAGGVSVAIGELADGLLIDLDRVPVKYEGLSATELAISESQERMAVVCGAADADKLIACAEAENLEATVVATVTQQRRLVMTSRGQKVVDLSRDFLDESGAKKHMNIRIAAPNYSPEKPVQGFSDALMRLAKDLNGASQQGLAQRFDSSIGAATVLDPYGGKLGRTQPMAMVHSLPVPGGSSSASYMSCGYNPFISEQSPYHGGYLAVVESISRLIAAGAPFESIYLSLQEFFPRPGQDAQRWGLPMAALLGAHRAQMGLQCAAIGGKDSMSGSFETLDVPPTLLSFAVTVADRARALSPELKRPGSKLYLIKPELGPDKLPTEASLKQVYDRVSALVKDRQVLACFSPGWGGIAYGLAQMAQGNGIGVAISDDVARDALFADCYGAFILEVQGDCAEGQYLGQSIEAPELRYGSEILSLRDLMAASDAVLEGIFPTTTDAPLAPVPLITSPHKPMKGSSIAKPRVLIPAFPGTNCEEDSARAFQRAGAQPQVFIINNLTGKHVAQSIQAFAQALRQSQMLLIPGGFSGGDEPDGSAKYITAFLRSLPVREALEELLHHRQGLVGGICNGFQALVKLGLLPYGRYQEADEHSPTLDHNSIGRHQSQLVNVRISSRLSPWFSRYELGGTYTLPVSNGEGRFLCGPEQCQQLADAGQIAAQYADPSGKPTLQIPHNPSASAFAVEALTSPDGRVMGRMGHSERMLKGLYVNRPNTGEDPLFLSAVEYFS